MTRTTIVTEPVAMTVVRSMTLAVDANGRFNWTITRRHAENDGCTLRTTQEKHGQVDQADTKLTFAVSGGIERFTTSCGRRGEVQIHRLSEIYTVQKIPQGIAMSGGASRWVFRR